MSDQMLCPDCSKPMYLGAGMNPPECLQCGPEVKLRVAGEVAVDARRVKGSLFISPDDPGDGAFTGKLRSSLGGTPEARAIVQAAKDWGAGISGWVPDLGTRGTRGAIMDALQAIDGVKSISVHDEAGHRGYVSVEVEVVRIEGWQSITRIEEVLQQQLSAGVEAHLKVSDQRCFYSNMVPAEAPMTMSETLMGQPQEVRGLDNFQPYVPVTVEAETPHRWGQKASAPLVDLEDNLYQAMCAWVVGTKTPNTAEGRLLLRTAAGDLLDLAMQGPKPVNVDIKVQGDPDKFAAEVQEMLATAEDVEELNEHSHVNDFVVDEDGNFPLVGFSNAQIHPKPLSLKMMQEAMEQIKSREPRYLDGVEMSPENALSYAQYYGLEQKVKPR